MQTARLAIESHGLLKCQPGCSKRSCTLNSVDFANLLHSVVIAP